jgi:hypothetical protein
MIESIAAPLSLIKKQYLNIIKECYNWGTINKDSKLEIFLDMLKENLTVFIEFPYVDKLYRDSYYHFFSASLQPKSRNCIRISFFSAEISKENFFDINCHDKIKDNCLGYLVIRPLNGKLLGRSFISPIALKKQDFLCCLSHQTISVMGIPLEVHGFPHSTQDGLMITCAETSIWAINEYFGSKYSEYSLVLPHEIHSVLKETYVQRPLPSNGLTAIQISTAMQQFGYSPRMYSINKNRSNEDEIFSITSDYIESGIPVIIAVQGGNFGGHALLLIGHSNIESDISKIILDEQFTDAGIFRKNYVSIDDNKSPFQLLNINNPLDSYNNDKYRNAKIVSVIVPMYQKMYLEAQSAKKLFETIFTDTTLGCKNYSETKWIVRRLLTSSRSYKKWVSKNVDISDNQRKILLELELPKFIWVAEYSSIQNYIEKKSDAMIILDATGMDNKSSLLFARYPDKYLVVDIQNSKQHSVSEESEPVPFYQNNLKGEWNQWKSN